MINSRAEVLQHEIKKSTKNDDIEQIVSNLINMKILADNLPKFTKIINAHIDTSLANIIATTSKNDPLFLAKLSRALQSDARGVGMIIIAEHEVLKGYETYLFNEETKRHDINYVLKHLDGDDLDVEELRHLYEYFETNYKKLIKRHMNENESSKTSLSNLIDEIKKLASTHGVNHTLSII